MYDLIYNIFQTSIEGLCQHYRSAARYGISSIGRTEIPTFYFSPYWIHIWNDMHVNNASCIYNLKQYSRASNDNMIFELCPNKLENNTFMRIHQCQMIVNLLSGEIRNNFYKRYS